MAPLNLNKRIVIFSGISFFNMIVLPIGSKLYRATKEESQLLQPHYCKDTEKIGCYFSFNDPFLADSMALEYKCPLYRAEFIVKGNIMCYNGKYSFLDLPLEEQNINHIDWDIGALTLFDDPDKYYAEVFLVEEELKKLEMVDCLIITPEEIKQRYEKFLVKNI